MFAGTLDVTLAVTLAAQLVVPRFAQWSGVYTTGEHGPRLGAVAARGRGRADALRGGPVEPERPAGSPSGSSASSPSARRCSRRTSCRPAVGAAAHGEVARRAAGGPPPAARRAARRPRGRRQHAAEDASLLLDLARRAALAIDNARLYEERTAIAQALQASLLPPALPAVPEVDFGARYAAGRRGQRGRRRLLRRLRAARRRLGRRDRRRLRQGRRGRRHHRAGPQRAAPARRARARAAAGRPAPAQRRRSSSSASAAGSAPRPGRPCAPARPGCGSSCPAPATRRPCCVAADGTAALRRQQRHLLGVARRRRGRRRRDAAWRPATRWSSTPTASPSAATATRCSASDNLLAALPHARPAGRPTPSPGMLERGGARLRPDASRDDLAVLVVQVPVVQVPQRRQPGGAVAAAG